MYKVRKKIEYVFRKYLILWLPVQLWCEICIKKYQEVYGIVSHFKFFFRA
jgi:hypothetical protein